MKVAVLGILPRPQEKANYERQRRSTSQRLQQELCSLKQELVRKKNGGVLFIDMDAILTPQMFSHDGVHLNQDGEVHMGNRILSWIKENAKLPHH